VRQLRGSGELSVLVFAGKTQQAMLTDDKGAQKLALTHLTADAVQSTPHLIAWLYFTSLLADADVVDDSMPSFMASRETLAVDVFVIVNEDAGTR
jgi:hypothetical protein